MGSILPRGPNQFRVQIRRNGVNICKTFETMAEAREFERITEGKVAAKAPVSKTAPAILSKACEWFDGQIGHHPNARNERNHARYWQTSKFAHWSLASIADWDLIEWVREVLDTDNAEEAEVGPGAQFGAQTCIHRLNALSKIFQLWGRAHKVVLTNPVKPGVRPKAPDSRTRRLESDETEKLLMAAEASSRPWLRSAIIIALETAIRQGELVALQWTDVNLERRFLDLRKTKNDRARRIPLSEQAVEAFQALSAYPKPIPVETTNGIIQAFRDINTFPDLHWHDLRHEAISRLFENTDLRDHEIMSISGHLTPAMLSRYTHLRSDKLADRLPGGRLNPRAQPSSPAR